MLPAGTVPSHATPAPAPTLLYTPGCATNTVCTTVEQKESRTSGPARQSLAVLFWKLLGCRSRSAVQPRTAPPAPKEAGGEERGVAGNIKAASATKQKFMDNHFQAKG